MNQATPSAEEDEETLAQTSREIEAIYAILTAEGLLAACSTGETPPEHGEAITELRARLRSAQEREAEAITRKYQRALRFSPAEGRRLVRRAKALLRAAKGE